MSLTLKEWLSSPRSFDCNESVAQALGKSELKKVASFCQAPATSLFASGLGDQ